MEKRTNRSDRFDLGGTADSSNTGANMGGTMGSSVMKHGGSTVKGGGVGKVRMKLQDEGGFDEYLEEINFDFNKNKIEFEDEDIIIVSKDIADEFENDGVAYVLMGNQFYKKGSTVKGGITIHELENRLSEHTQVVDDKTLDSEEIHNWGADNVTEYKKAQNEIDKIKYKGKGWEIYGWYDVSSFDYWIIKQEEQNYIQITIKFKNETVKEEEVDEIADALDSALADADRITNKYNYNPSKFAKGSTVKGGGGEGEFWAVASGRKLMGAFPNKKPTQSQYRLVGTGHGWNIKPYIEVQKEGAKDREFEKWELVKEPTDYYLIVKHDYTSGRETNFYQKPKNKYANGGGLLDLPENPNNDTISYKTGGKVDAKDYYEQLAVYVQGVGSIYNGTSMKKAIEKANLYLKKNPKAEIVISDEKYGDTYDLNGNMTEEDKMKQGGITKNEDLLESFLTNNDEVKIGNLSTHYSTLGDVVLLRNYGTLIAKRRGKFVSISTKKYSSTTSKITNKVEALAKSMGLKVEKINEDQFKNGGVSDSDFEKDYKKVKQHIKEGYGKIDSGYVETTWENMSDITYSAIEDKLMRRLKKDELFNYAEGGTTKGFEYTIGGL